MENNQHPITPDEQSKAQQPDIFFRKSPFTGSFVEHNRDLHRFTCGGVVYHDSSMTLEAYERYLKENSISVCMAYTFALINKGGTVDTLQIMSDIGLATYVVAIKTVDGTVAVLTAMDCQGGAKLVSLEPSDQILVKLTCYTYLSVHSIK